MLDIRFIRDNVDLVQEAARNKKVDIDIQRLVDVDTQRRHLMTEIERVNQRRKELAKAHSKTTIEEARDLKKQLVRLEEELKPIHEEYDRLMKRVPNIPSQDTPIGPDESYDKTLRTIGEKPVFDFEPKEHWELGTQLDILDTQQAVRVTGPRFTYLKRELALLQFALVQYVMGILTSEETLKTIIQNANLSVDPKLFIPVVPPVMIKPEIMDRMGRLEPKEERYYIPSDDVYLIGSAEHTLGPLHMDETLPQTALPIRYVGFSPAFRREAGSYGKDLKGIVRLHQFDKIELESFATPETGAAEQDFFVAIQEYIVQSLKLPYRVIIVCTGEMGDPDARHIDIETWMPGQKKYRETHTSDYMTDYQARRLKIKVKRNTTTDFVHMNDATAVAVGRILVAIMENYQQHDGTIAVPEVLHPYVSFRTIVGNRTS